jgi:phage terminase Nu1 subunit (DNA packaging protein)
MAENVQPAEIIAKLLDVTERRVRQLSSEGVIPKAARGRYEVVGAVRGYIRYLRNLALKGEVGAADYGLERARLVKARADLAEMEATRIRGDLIPAAEVTAAWTEMVALMRARLLALPDKIAPQLFTSGAHETTSIAEARDMLRNAVFEALGELAATEVRLRPSTDGDGGLAAGGDDDPEDGRTPSEADGDGVGGPEPQA